MNSNVQYIKKLAFELEQSEAIYWGKLYQDTSDLSALKMQIQDAWAFALPEVDILGMNRVIGWGFTGAESSQDLRRFINFYQQCGCKRFFLQLSPLAPGIERLRMLLSENGFSFYNNWSKLCRSMDNLDPNVSSFLTCKTIGTDLGKTYGKIIKEGFNWKESRLVDFLASSIGKQGYKHYLVYLENKPIAAGAFHWYNQFGSLAFAATLPEYRGLGAQSLLIHQRIREAKSLGIRYLFTETAQHNHQKPCQSFKNLQKFGFDLAYQRENWIYIL